MCGRYTLYHYERDLAALFEVEGLALEPRYNIAPSQPVPVVRQRPDGLREALTARWGLVPHWVKDRASFRPNLFNARAEGVADKPSFREAARRWRCLVPASGFYEWSSAQGVKRPYHIRRRDGRALAFAGLWSVWSGGEAPLLSCTILTTRPNAVVEGLHDRMPVILDPDEFEAWLDPAVQDFAALEPLLDPYDDGALESYAVSRAVGNPSAEGPALIEPEAA